MPKKTKKKTTTSKSQKPKPKRAYVLPPATAVWKPVLSAVSGLPVSNAVRPRLTTIETRRGSLDGMYMTNILSGSRTSSPALGSMEMLERMSLMSVSPATRALETQSFSSVSSRSPATRALETQSFGSVSSPMSGVLYSNTNRGAKRRASIQLENTNKRARTGGDNDLAAIRAYQTRNRQLDFSRAA